MPKINKKVVPNTNYPSVARYCFKKKSFIENKIEEQVKKTIENDVSGATAPTTALFTESGQVELAISSEISMPTAPTVAVFSESDQVELAISSEISMSTAPTAAVLSESGQAGGAVDFKK